MKAYHVLDALRQPSKEGPAALPEMVRVSMDFLPDDLIMDIDRRWQEVKSKLDPEDFATRDLLLPLDESVPQFFPRKKIELQASDTLPIIQRPGYEAENLCHTFPTPASRTEDVAIQEFDVMQQPVNLGHEHKVLEIKSRKQHERLKNPFCFVGGNI